MSETSWFCALLAFVVGGHLGIWSTHRLWRGKAKSGFRMASGGKLYVVREDLPEAETSMQEDVGTPKTQAGQQRSGVGE